MNHVLLRAWRDTLRREGTRTAVTDAPTGRATTFRELEAGARAWLERHAASAAGLRGRSVVFALPNGASWLEVFLALQYAGAVGVPLDPGEPAAAQEAAATAIRAAWRWDGTRLVPLPAPHRRFRDPSVCLIKLTSGSTGRPRPLLFSAAQMLADGRQIAAAMGITRREVNYAIIPLGHSYGLGNLAIPLLAGGVPLVVGSAPLPQAIAADFARWHPTVLAGVPAIFRGLTASDIGAADLASLRIAISAGAPLAPEVARDFAGRFGRRIHGFYGSSETGGISYDRSGTDTLSGKSVGRALRGVHLRSRPGWRLSVCSAAVFTLGNRRRRGRRGCWIPPDRVALGPDGRVRLLGRRGTTVKIAGRRVGLEEVAARLRRIPGVREVWVGVERQPVEAIGAALATDRTLEEIKRAMRDDTAPWKTPKRWAVLAEFPLTPRGKIDRAVLQRLVFG